MKLYLIASYGDARGHFPNVDDNDGDGVDGVNKDVGIVRRAGVSSFGFVLCCLVPQC